MARQSCSQPVGWYQQMALHGLVSRFIAPQLPMDGTHEFEPEQLVDQHG
jgi:hypothetical protein